jgi:hypothetical protein
MKWAGKDWMPLYQLRITNEKQGWRNSRPAVELLAGDVRQADGSVRRLRRLIDRRSDRYVEQLTDPRTETPARPITDQPLSAHQGHGSAKPELRNQPYRRRQARRS